ncbi:MAG: CapA family protein [Gaiellaceae bacterium]
MNSNSGDGAITVLAVGDVFLDRPEPAAAFDNVRDVLAAGDVVIANFEGVYADEWERAPSAIGPVVAPTGPPQLIVEAGFNVITLANNHSVDAGHSGLLGTRDAFREAGAVTAGAGENIGEARQPAIVETGGRTVAVLAYSSNFPHGYEARGEVAGLAPLRAHNIYTPWEPGGWDPGARPRVTTTPHVPDHMALAEDVAGAAERADVVIVTVHWGDFSRPFVLTDHERRAARAAIDAGAHAVLGHHHHVLRAVDEHAGRPIFYGLGHFAFDLPNLEQRSMAEGILAEAADPDWLRGILRRFGDFRLGSREGYPLLPFHPDARMTAISVLRFHDDGRIDTGLVPCILGPDNCPRPVEPGSEECGQVVDYLNRCCAEEFLQASFADEGMTVGPAAALTVAIGEQAAAGAESVAEPA